MNEGNQVKLLCPMCKGEVFVDGALTGAVYVPNRGGLFAMVLGSAVRGALAKMVPVKTCLKCGFAAIIIPRDDRT